MTRATAVARAPLRVFLVQNCVPHYRVPLFRRLSVLDDAEFTVVADERSDTAFLQVASAAELAQLRHRSVRTYAVGGVGRELTAQPGAVRLVGCERPDVVVALGNPRSLTAWALCVVGRALGIPVLLWGHGLARDERGWRWRVRAALYGLSAGQLVYGERAKALLTAKGCDASRIAVVYNSLDVDRQLEIASGISSDVVARRRAALGVAAGERLVAFVGRIQPAKRLDLLVDALALLDRRGERVHAALVGDGGAASAVAAQAAEAGIGDRVHLHGASYDERFLGEVLSAADLCVIPASAGLAVMHALVYGTPVVIDDAAAGHGPEAEAVADGITGLRFAHGSAESLAAALERGLFPEPMKAAVRRRCERVVRERYHPARQAALILAAARDAASAAHEPRRAGALR